jgi:hypothetical protein
MGGWQLKPRLGSLQLAVRQGERPAERFPGAILIAGASYQRLSSWRSLAPERYTLDATESPIYNHRAAEAAMSIDRQRRYVEHAGQCE